MADETIPEFPTDTPAVTQPETLPAPEADPRDERVAELTARLREQEALTQRMYDAAMQQRQQPAQPVYAPETQNRDPFADAPSPEWRESLQTTYRHLGPVIERQFAPVLRGLEQRASNAEALSERLMLRQQAQTDPKYAAFAQLEQDAVTVQQAYRQQGMNLPLQAIYGYLAFERGLTGTADQVAQAEQRGNARARVAGNGRVETAAPASSGQVRAGMPTLEQIKSWPTDKLDQLAALIGETPV